MPTPSPSPALTSPAAVPAPPLGVNLVDHCLQGHSLGSALLEAWGQRLAHLHTQTSPLTSSLAEASEAWHSSLNASRLGVWQHPADADTGLPPALNPATPALAKVWHRWHSQQPQPMHTLASALLANSFVGGDTSQPQALPSILPCITPHQLSLLPQGQGWQLAAGLTPLPNGNTAWEMGQWLAWLPLLGYANYSGQNLAYPFAKSYLAAMASQEGLVSSGYEALRHGLQVGGLLLVTLLLTPNALPWVHDVYLKETLLHEAHAMLHAPHKLTWTATVGV
jgi:hypothetical protein